MDAFLIILKNVLIFVALAVPGFILAKTKLMGEKESGVLSKLLVYVGMPFLIVSGVAKIQFNKATLTLLGFSALIGIAFHIALIFVSIYLTGKGEKTKTGMERFCMIFANNGFIGIPLALAVFGGASPVFTCLIVINILTNLIMYIWGTRMVAETPQPLCSKSFVDPDLSTRMVAETPQPLSWKKIAFNPLLIAFAIGVVINLTGIMKAVPETVTYSTYLSNLVTPLSMLIIGLKLGDVQFKKFFTSGRMYYVSFMKLVVVPVAVVGVLLLIRLILPVSDALIIGSFIAFAMPTAGLAPTYAKMYGGDEENAVCYTLGTTIFCIATIPLLYLLLTVIL